MDKRLLTILLLFLFEISVAQIKTQVIVNASNDLDLKYKMEQSITLLVDEINWAFKNKKIPTNPNSNLISDSVIKYFNESWKENRFKVITSPSLILNCLRLKSGGYQVRNIHVFFSDAAEENQKSEIGFNFNDNGRMIELFICIPEQRYSLTEINHKTEHDELRKEKIILLLEKFRSAYNNSDSTFLEKIYSDKALIIIGRVLKVMQRVRENDEISIKSGEKVEFYQVSKREYLDKLKVKFRRHDFINVKFSSIEILQNKDVDKADWYGIRLKQEWYSKARHSEPYHDTGYLFLVIDFSNDNQPVIWVRAWEPDIIDGRDVPREKLFSFRDVIFNN